MKKAAIMLYPRFSMQEISCTTELFLFYDKEIVTFSADGGPVKSEDGFTILPDRPFDEFCRGSGLPDPSRHLGAAAGDAGPAEHPVFGAVPGG